MLQFLSSGTRPKDASGAAGRIEVAGGRPAEGLDGGNVKLPVPLQEEHF